ncbi:MAG: 50S ribosomal protein L29 [Gemmatales bacterium]|nr:50S ribosomal protein L29 [Gemmatales bacterium]MDW8386821.1 50S ribosomal protein L29 [Gemmatales bacterium]
MATKPLKPAELRQMSPEQLALTLKDTVKQLFSLRFQATTERVETPSEMRKLRRDIARIKTIMRERELQKERQAKP